MIYAVTYNTESGDEGFAGLYLDKPSEAQLDTIAREDFPQEYEDGDCTIYFKVYPVPEVKKLPNE